jgi:quercetin dioxygenase-like cupin family protein
MVEPSSFSLLPGEGVTQNILGTAHLYKVSAAQTAGQMSCVEAMVPPGAGIPPHVHTREDESFFVLEGTLTFATAEQELRLGPGGFFLGVRGKMHSFRNDSSGNAKLLIHAVPGENIDAMFAELHELTTRGNFTPAEAGEICGRYGISFC